MVGPWPMMVESGPRLVEESIHVWPAPCQLRTIPGRVRSMLDRASTHCGPTSTVGPDSAAFGSGRAKDEPISTTSGPHWAKMAKYQGNLTRHPRSAKLCANSAEVGHDLGPEYRPSLARLRPSLSSLRGQSGTGIDQHRPRNGQTQQIARTSTGVGQRVLVRWRVAAPSAKRTAACCPPRANFRSPCRPPAALRRCIKSERPDVVPKCRPEVVEELRRSARSRRTLANPGANLSPSLSKVGRSWVAGRRLGDHRNRRTPRAIVALTAWLPARISADSASKAAVRCFKTRGNGPTLACPPPAFRPSDRTNLTTCRMLEPWQAQVTNTAESVIFL